MMPFADRLRDLGRRAGSLLAAALVAACGGGVDSGGTGSGPQAAVAAGPITGFGSIVVDGIHFDDRNATVRDADGNVRSRTDLRLGMTTEAKGSALSTDSDGNDASTATSIVFGSEIVGRVTANDVAGRTLVVFGQAVDVSPATVFDIGLTGGQAAIAVGDILEVYASFDAASGRYAATRIERKTSVTAFVLRGVVSNLNTVGQTFIVGGVTVSYASVPIGGVPASLANGRFVRVSVALVPGAGGIFPALRIVDGSAQLGDAEQARIRGLVTAFVSATQFSVAGTPVDARNAQFPDGNGVALGKRVEVRGAISGGTLVATRVDIVSDDEEDNQPFEVEDTIASIDTGTKTFVVRSVTVSYAGTVQFNGGGAADLRLGRKVRVRGQLSADGTLLQAARIDFRD